MKLSKFNLWVEDYPEQNKHLLFNTRTQALLKIDQDLKEDLEKLSGSRLTENLNALQENVIIVKDDAEENSKLKDFFRQLKYECDKYIFETTILTTYSCNFRCLYCFEESVREKIFMDKDTSDLVIKWLTNHAEKRKLKKIYLVYYGGEPLLNVRPIYDISWHMQDWARKNGVSFAFGIVTNGSLIYPDLIDKFLSVGLNEVRVTIDGDRDTHNKNRPFSDGKPSFDLIINNVKSIIDKVKVAVAGNFDRESFSGITRLLDYLDTEGLLYKLDYFVFAPIVPRLGPKENPSAVELSHCLSFLEKDGLFKEVLSIKRELLRRKLKIRTSGLAVNACPLTMQDAGVTIDPQGKIYKCNSLLGYPEFSVGDVRDEEFNQNADNFLNIDAWEKCPADCPYVPMCQGGCRLFSYLENKNFSDLSCKRGYFDRITPELIKLEYEKITKQA